MKNIIAFFCEHKIEKSLLNFISIRIALEQVKCGSR